MKNVRFVLFGLSVLLMAAAAEAQQTKMQAEIPFDFVVGDRSYPAGEYSLKSVTGDGTVIQFTNDLGVRNVPSNSCRNATPATQSKLVFRKMGDEYFLYQIWTAGNLSGREFPKSNTEIRLAQRHEKSQLVIVAANIPH